MAKKATSDTESTISMILGGLVVVVLGILVYNYFTNLNKPADKKESQEKKVSIEKKEEEKKENSIKGDFPQEYKVKTNDNLWSIAEKAYGSGYNWLEIAKKNKLPNPNHIETGQKLTLPKIEKPIGDLNGPGIQTTDKKAITKKEYTVKDGDYLWDIAIRACGDGYAWIKIAEANKLNNPDLIHPGNKFKIVCK